MTDGKCFVCQSHVRLMKLFLCCENGFWKQNILPLDSMCFDVGHCAGVAAGN
jgi:hypothetical protein